MVIPLYYSREIKTLLVRLHYCCEVFFYFPILLGCVNATKIVLVMKIETPTTMNDFKLISYCNIMYKYISKVIVNRLKGIFPEVI